MPAAAAAETLTCTLASATMAAHHSCHHHPTTKNLTLLPAATAQLHRTCKRIAPLLVAFAAPAYCHRLPQITPPHKLCPKVPSQATSAHTQPPLRLCPCIPSLCFDLPDIIQRCLTPPIGSGPNKKAPTSSPQQPPHNPITPPYPSSPLLLPPRTWAGQVHR